MNHKRTLTALRCFALLCFVSVAALLFLLWFFAVLSFSFHLCYAFAPVMHRKQGDARIVILGFWHFKKG